MTSRIFFTSDWHIGHQKVLEFDERPFRNLEHMHQVLINNYNASVKDQDLVYFLGDVGLCKSGVLNNVVSQLNGTKICLIGNHDGSKQSLLNAGFSAVLNSASFFLGNNKITMSHCPLRGVWREDVTGMKGAVDGESWHGEFRHGMIYSVADEGQFHLHGHTHKTPKERILNRQYDVGVRANNYRPVSMSEIESWIAKYGRPTSP